MKVKSTKKEIIILRHNGGRLGNQLLLYISIYAFCLEMGYECINYSFYNYRTYFNIPKKDIYMHFFDLFGKLKMYKSHSTHLIVYFIYKIFSYLYQFFKKGVVIKENPDSMTYLPPTKISKIINQNLIQSIVKSPGKVFYIEGWAFRNPVGIKKYHKQIQASIKPKKSTLDKISEFLAPFKGAYLIGVHIRQGDYKRFQNGALYFSQEEVVGILKTYLKNKFNRTQKVKFIICSDGKIDLKVFKDLNASVGPGELIEDLFVLSRCNLIIGSSSTFGEFAAYYGKIPFIEFGRELIKN